MGRPAPSSLPAALRESAVEPALQELTRERHGASAELAGLRVEPVRRGVVRYAVELRGGGAWSVIGKAYDTREGAEHGMDALRCLWDAGFQDLAPRSVRVPRPYALVPELRMILMEDVGGATLKRLLKGGRAEPRHMRLFAEALAKLHGFPASFGAPFTVDDHLERRCAGLAGPLGRAMPELAAPIERIVATARRLEESDKGALTLAHGDYHPGQVHVAESALWILDLDPLHHGDPAYDVAMVLVTLGRMAHERTERNRAAPEDLHALRDAFLSAYFARMDLRIARRIPLNAALIHLKRACKRFRWQDEPGWERTVRRQIPQAAECLDAMGEQAPRDVDEVIALDARCPAAV